MPLHEFSRHDSVRHQYVLFYSYHANIRKKRFPSSRILFRQSFPHLESSYHGGYISFAFSISAMISHKNMFSPLNERWKIFHRSFSRFLFLFILSLIFFFLFRLISQISLIPSLSTPTQHLFIKKSKICQEKMDLERERKREKRQGEPGAGEEEGGGCQAHQTRLSLSRPRQPWRRPRKILRGTDHVLQVIAFSISSQFPPPRPKPR